jgi:membrane-associated protein
MDLDLTTLLILTFPAAILGDNLGYYLGRKYGPSMFKQEEGKLFGKQQLARAQAFFEKHGGKTITLARFVPVFRSFVPMIAGIGRMPYRTFMLYNIIGAVAWAVGLQLAGYYLGKSIPNIDTYLLPIIGGIILISAGPPAWKILSNKETREAIWAELKNYIFR